MCRLVEIANSTDNELYVHLYNQHLTFMTDISVLQKYKAIK